MPTSNFGLPTYFKDHYMLMPYGQRAFLVKYLLTLKPYGLIPLTASYYPPINDHPDHQHLTFHFQLRTSVFVTELACLPGRSKCQLPTICNEPSLRACLSAGQLTNGKFEDFNLKLDNKYLTCSIIREMK
jgi:hypothetical protein